MACVGSAWGTPKAIDRRFSMRITTTLGNCSTMNGVHHVGSQQQNLRRLHPRLCRGGSERLRLFGSDDEVSVGRPNACSGGRTRGTFRTEIRCGRFGLGRIMGRPMPARLKARSGDGA